MTNCKDSTQNFNTIKLAGNFQLFPTCIADNVLLGEDEDVLISDVHIIKNGTPGIA